MCVHIDHHGHDWTPNDSWERNNDGKLQACILAILQQPPCDGCENVGHHVRHVRLCDKQYCQRTGRPSESDHFPDFLWRNEEKVALANKVVPVGEDGGGYALESVQFAADVFADEALRFVEENKSRPFFCTGA